MLLSRTYRQVPLTECEQLALSTILSCARCSVARTRTACTGATRHVGAGCSLQLHAHSWKLQPLAPHKSHRA